MAAPFAPPPASSPAPAPDPVEAAWARRTEAWRRYHDAIHNRRAGQAEIEARLREAVEAQDEYEALTCKERRNHTA